MGAWRESQQGSQQFDKAQCENEQHMTKVLYHMALVGNAIIEELFNF